MKSIVEIDAPRPSLVWPDCPPELEAIVMRGAARASARRASATAEELQLALEAFARERRLAVSNAGLGRYVRELFAPRAQALREAQAAGDDAVTVHVLAELASRPNPAEDGAAEQGASSAVSGLGTRAMPIAPRRPGSARLPSAVSARARRVTVAAALAAAVVASAGVLVAQPYFAPPAELPPPQRSVPVARVELPVRAELPSRASLPSPPSPPSLSLAKRAAQASTRATAHRHLRSHAPAAAHGTRWDVDAALPPP